MPYSWIRCAPCLVRLNTGNAFPSSWAQTGTLNPGLHEARRRENTHLNTHRYLLLQGGTMRFQSADSSFTLHPGDVLFTPSGYHYSYLLSEDARYTNVFFFLHPPAEPIPDSALFFVDGDVDIPDCLRRLFGRFDARLKAFFRLLIMQFGNGILIALLADQSRRTL